MSTQTNRLAAEEMTDCPDCGIPTYQIGPCSKCSAIRDQREASERMFPHDPGLEEYRQRRAAKDIEWRRQEQERIAELDRKAAAYDAFLEYRNTEKERNGGWTDDELKQMTAFARGYIAAIKASLMSGIDVNQWITYAEDVDIHLQTNDDTIIATAISFLAYTVTEICRIQVSAGRARR